MTRDALTQLLADRFTADHWDRGISKSDLIEAAGDDTQFLRLFEQLPVGGLYRSPDDVIEGMPHRGWEDQGLAGPIDRDRSS